MIEPWLKKLSSSALADLDQSLKTSFSRVKEELDEHLEAINTNTNEIQTNYEYLAELEKKVEKLNEKVERVLELLEGKKEEPVYTIDELTLREQEVFAALYASDAPLSYLDISHKIALPQDMIRQLIQSLLSKGVPIMKRYADDVLIVELDAEFKQHQAKTNQVQISEPVIRHASSSHL